MLFRKSFGFHILLRLCPLLLVAGTQAQNYSLQTLAGGPLVTEGSSALTPVLRYPLAVASDPTGNVYIADREDNLSWKVDTNGAITTFAGTGASDYAGDNGPAAQASLNHPAGVAADGSGAVCICDTGNSAVRRVGRGNARIRLVTPDGVVQTIAGNGVSYPFNGDGPALLCNFSPYRIAIDTDNDIYVADWANDRVRLLAISR